ncbi:sensor histidine kinase [Metabacillus arenae]|uniref:histidine kinase n=1 Tax=Metabacillus arenae TaxID=2771434 RepID=A0A926NKD5_9BACI|nr:HAMP domain-containing sensor histidine kinase [Metabacillus arenae]MBD1382213.1 HAMP domain-containing histidine kinase [Metabacillus arenae]
MKIRYFYQLLASHISILIIAFLILTAMFSQFVQGFIFDNKVEELTTHGESILNELNSFNFDSMQKLDHYNEVLSARKVQFAIFNHESKVLFPTRQRLIVNFTNEEWAELKRGNKLTIKRDFKRYEQDVTFVALPQFQNNQFVGGILLISPISGSEDVVNQINRYLVFTMIIALTAAFILSFVLSKFYEKRIQRMREATSMVASGNYNVDVQANGWDEIGALAKDFNRMAEKLKLSNDEIERLEKRRRQFMADVSHELRTPLTTMSGLMEGLRNDMIPDVDREKSMALIEKETKRLIRLVNENLDYEKIRSNQITLNKEKIALDEAFEIIKEQLWSQLLEKQNRMHIEAGKEVEVYADYDRLIQILINITKNSIQFTEHGEIWLRARMHKEGTIIEIEDTGMGMNKQEIESIWERFFKADISRSNNLYGEFGLGLSIVKQLVLLHNGEISVESEKGKGTKFIILLPK